MLAALQIGCSGGGGDNVAGGGIGGSGVTVSSVGTVTGFGSVIVDGVSYETSAAEVFAENASAGSGDQTLVRSISVGMVVRVEGKLAPDGSSIAERVFFSSDLMGPVESIVELDGVSKQASILGQTILMDDRTVYRNTDAGAIAAGMVLKVSGFADESGSIEATYIEKVSDSLAPGGSVAVKGFVENLNPQSKTFNINLLGIDYSIADLSQLPNGSLETGQLLKVAGKLQEPGLLVAERLVPEEEFGTGLFDTVDLEGIITQTDPANGFRIRRYIVTVDSGTVYKNLKPADVNQGTRVIVRGTLTNRSILADEISRPETIRIESNVGSIDLAAGSLVLVGLEPASVSTAATTRFIGIASGLDVIEPGDHVRILGRRTSTGRILASSIQVTPSNDTVELAGPVESVARPTLVVLGVAIDTGSIPADGFFGLDGKRVSATEFFDSVKAGDIVFAEAVLQNGGVIWNSVGFE